MKRADIYKTNDNIGITIFQDINTKDLFNITEVVEEITDKFATWTTLQEIEVGYEPVETAENCPQYSMQKAIVKFNDGEKTINITNVVRQKAVYNWEIYYKIVIPNKNIVRNLDIIVKKFGTRLSMTDKENARLLTNGKIEYFSI